MWAYFNEIVAKKCKNASLASGRNMHILSLEYSFFPLGGNKKKTKSIQA